MAWTWRRATRWATACAVVVAMWTAAARAEDDPEALIHRGVELRRQGDDLRAEALIRRAYELAPSPHTEAQLGLVELALDRNLDAEMHLSEALTTNDPWVSSHRDILETTRAKLRKQLASVQIVGAPPDATVARADRPSTRVPASGIVWVEPGYGLDWNICQSDSTSIELCNPNDSDPQCLRAGSCHVSSNPTEMGNCF